MKVTLTVKSCHRHVDRRQACIDTWLKDWPQEFTFLVGQPTKRFLPYCLMIETSDAFTDIAPKVKAACNWALNQNSDYLVIADDDTYLRPERLLKSGFESHDYVGWVRPMGDVSNGFKPYIQGNCFILSAKAMEVISKSQHMHYRIPDDCATGMVLHGEVRLTHEHRFWPGPNAEQFYPLSGNEIISTHKALPNDMRKIHEAWLRS